MIRTFLVLAAVTLLIASVAGGFRGIGSGGGKCTGSGCSTFG